MRCRVPLAVFAAFGAACTIGAAAAATGWTASGTGAARSSAASMSAPTSITKGSCTYNKVSNVWTVTFNFTWTPSASTTPTPTEQIVSYGGKGTTHPVLNNTTTSDQDKWAQPTPGTYAITEAVKAASNPLLWTASATKQFSVLLTQVNGSNGNCSVT